MDVEAPPPPPPSPPPPPPPDGPLPPAGAAGQLVHGSGGLGGQPYFKPEQLFFVFMEGLPARKHFNFGKEFVEPCKQEFGTAVFDSAR
jgi:hypothetical protein